MKKVHLVVGVTAGIAGMLGIPAAAAATTPTPSKSRGTLSIRVPGQPKAAAADCPVDAQTSALSTHRVLLGGIGFGGACVAWQGATLDRGQTGLTERVRFYTSGRLTRTTRLAGLDSNGHTYFGSYPRYDATEVCQALVANGTSDVKYGPVCEYTSG